LKEKPVENNLLKSFNRGLEYSCSPIECSRSSNNEIKLGFFCLRIWLKGIL